MEITQEIYFQIRLPGSVLERQCQGLFKSVIQRACSYFQMSLNYNQKYHKFLRKCLEAKFRGRFCQVQQVNVKAKNNWEFPRVFIKLYKKCWAIFTIKWLRQKICHETKKLQFDRVILRPGWNLPYGLILEQKTGVI